MAKSGILHIGLPKTGTTSCQEALYANREMLLARHGTLYPSVAPSHNSMLSVMFLEDPRTNVTVKSKGITTREGAEALRRRYFAQMEADLARVSWDRLVLSSEGLSSLSPARLEKLREWLGGFADDWTVLLWSRHPVSYTTSNIQQHIKGGRVLEDLLTDPPLPNLKRRAANAFRVFGRDNVRITSFEDAKAEPGGVVAAFCRRLGLPEDTALEIGASTVTRNESMSMLATLLLSHLNRQRPRFVGGRLNPERCDQEIQLFRRLKGEKFRLPAEAEIKIRRQSRVDVEWLNETLGTSHYLDVLSEAAPERSAPDHYSPEMLDSLALLMSDLINRHETRAEHLRRGMLSWWRRRSA
jgi:hypothetical protein